ncbi:hypothetical protein HMPREF0578_2211 [Mobiluncus mulieris 28-1]|nr:hypothetical protein HMPREF0578_2211 [Mobiluncus mulieris 28-1]
MAAIVVIPKEMTLLFITVPFFRYLLRLSVAKTHRKRAENPETRGKITQF